MLVILMWNIPCRDQGREFNQYKLSPSPLPIQNTHIPLPNHAEQGPDSMQRCHLTSIGDKTVGRSSYLHNGISYTGKMASLYWNSPQGLIHPYVLSNNEFAAYTLESVITVLGLGHSGLQHTSINKRTGRALSCFVVGWLLLITMTSWWARWRLKSSVSRLLAQPLVQAQIKENIKAPCHWPLRGESIADRWIPHTRASYAENVSIWWRHHAYPVNLHHQHWNNLTIVPVPLAIVRGIDRWSVDSPHKGQLRWKCFHLMMSSCISCRFTSPTLEKSYDCASASEATLTNMVEKVAEIPSELIW